MRNDVAGCVHYYAPAAIDWQTEWFVEGRGVPRYSESINDIEGQYTTAWPYVIPPKNIAGSRLLVGYRGSHCAACPLALLCLTLPTGIVRCKDCRTRWLVEDQQTQPDAKQVLSPSEQRQQVPRECDRGTSFYTHACPECVLALVVPPGFMAWNLRTMKMQRAEIPVELELPKPLIVVKRKHAEGALITLATEKDWLDIFASDRSQEDVRAYCRSLKPEVPPSDDWFFLGR